MFVVHNGRVCVMVWDEKRREYVYIPENEYYKGENDHEKY